MVVFWPALGPIQSWHAGDDDDDDDVDRWAGDDKRASRDPHVK